MAQLEQQTKQMSTQSLPGVRYSIHPPIFRLLPALVLFQSYLLENSGMWFTHKRTKRLLHFMKWQNDLQIKKP